MQLPHAPEVPSALMADSLYPQVLAYMTGLGDLVDVEKILAQMEREAEWNDSPWGIYALSDEYGEDFFDLGNYGNGVWQMATGDWSALNLRLNQEMSFEESMSQVKKSIGGWREGVNDLWNVAGIAEQANGLPTITSHYGYWMTMWHVVFAASKQDIDMVEGVIAFEPVVEPPYKLPVLLAGTLGVLSSNDDGTSFEFSVTAGKDITLKELRVGDVVYDNRGGGAFTMTAGGESVKWE